MMANQKQQKNATIRKQDAAKRGRERQTRQRERNIGHKNAQEHSRKDKSMWNK